MINNSINIYWFKRDLRIIDNEPLYELSKKNKPILLLYVLEKTLINDKHYSELHWNFIKQSLEDINQYLGKKFILFIKSDIITALTKIKKKFRIDTIHSHMETGLDVTYQRDKKVFKFCNLNSIKWCEYEKNSVERGLKNRKNWTKRWNDYVNSPIVNLDINTVKFIEPNLFNDVFEILETKTIRNKNIQPGGTLNALKYLKSFLEF